MGMKWGGEGGGGEEEGPAGWNEPNKNQVLDTNLQDKSWKEKE